MNSENRAKVIEVESGKPIDPKSFEFGNILYSGRLGGAVIVGKTGIIFNHDPRDSDVICIPIHISGELEDPQEFYKEVVVELQSFMLEVRPDQLTPEQDEEYATEDASTYWIVYRNGEIEDILPPDYFDF